MQRLILPAIFLFALSFMISACGSDDDDGNGIEPTPEPIIRLIAAAHPDPTFDNALTADVWDSITAVSIPTGTKAAYNSTGVYTTGLTVEMKALVADDSLLYIWAKWNDNDEDNRYGQMRSTWIHGANTFQFSNTLGADTIVYNEDRFMIMFDNGGTNGADCAVYCHNLADSSSAGKRFYGTGASDADMWIWRAHRTGLSDLSDDGYVSDVAIKGDAQNTLGDSLYFRNWGNSGRPKYMHSDSTEYTGAGLLESQAPGQLFDTLKYNLIWGTFPPLIEPVGLNLPGFFIWDVSGNDGSRWDVQTKAAHDGTQWTAVFRRNLTPTDDNDRDFVAVDSVSMSIAVSDNSDKHNGRMPFYLVFE